MTKITKFKHTFPSYDVFFLKIIAPLRKIHGNLEWLNDQDKYYKLEGIYSYLYNQYAERIQYHVDEEFLGYFKNIFTQVTPTFFGRVQQLIADQLSSLKDVKEAGKGSTLNSDSKKAISTSPYGNKMDVLDNVDNQQESIFTLQNANTNLIEIAARMANIKINGEITRYMASFKGLFTQYKLGEDVRPDMLKNLIDLINSKCDGNHALPDANPDGAPPANITVDTSIPFVDSWEKFNKEVLPLDENRNKLFSIGFTNGFMGLDDNEPLLVLIRGDKTPYVMRGWHGIAEALSEKQDLLTVFQKEAIDWAEGAKSQLHIDALRQITGDTIKTLDNVDPFSGWGEDITFHEENGKSYLLYKSQGALRKVVEISSTSIPGVGDMFTYKEPIDVLERLRLDSESFKGLAWMDGVKIVYQNPKDAAKNITFNLDSSYKAYSFERLGDNLNIQGDGLLIDGQPAPDLGSGPNHFFPTVAEFLTDYTDQGKMNVIFRLPSGSFTEGTTILKLTYNTLTTKYINYLLETINHKVDKPLSAYEIVKPDISSQAGYVIMDESHFSKFNVDDMFEIDLDNISNLGNPPSDDDRLFVGANISVTISDSVYLKFKGKTNPLDTNIADHFMTDNLVVKKISDTEFRIDRWVPKPVDTSITKSDIINILGASDMALEADDGTVFTLKVFE